MEVEKKKRERDLGWLKGWRRGGSNNKVYTRTVAGKVFYAVNFIIKKEEEDLACVKPSE